MDVNELSLSLLSGLISGVLATILCTILFRFLKPKIRIADCIAESSEDGKPVYKLKIVNLSRNYAKNIHIAARLIDRQNTPDHSIVVQTRPLAFVRTDFQFIEPYKKSDDEARYAVRLKFTSDIRALWTDPNHSKIELAIYCENEVTGVGKVFKKTYSSLSHIKKGTYETGKSTKIIQG